MDTGIQVSGANSDNVRVRLKPDTLCEHGWNSEPQNIEQEISNNEDVLSN